VAETRRLTNGLGADLIVDGVGKATFTGNLEAVAMAVSHLYPRSRLFELRRFATADRLVRRE